MPIQQKYSSLDAIFFVDKRRLKGLRRLARREDSACLLSAVILIGSSEQNFHQEIFEALIPPQAPREISSIGPNGYCRPQAEMVDAGPAAQRCNLIRPANSRAITQFTSCIPAPGIIDLCTISQW